MLNEVSCQILANATKHINVDLSQFYLRRHGTDTVFSGSVAAICRETNTRMTRGRLSASCAQIISKFHKAAVSALSHVSSASSESLKPGLIVGLTHII